MLRRLITAAALIAGSAGVTLAQDVDEAAAVFKTWRDEPGRP
jgi:hypothetical protein